MKRILLIGLLLLPLVSQAAIYKCVDERGVASFSQRPCPVKKIEGDSEAHKLHKEMGVLLSDGQSLVNSVSGDMQSIIACQDARQGFIQRWQLLQSRVDALEVTHKNLKKAHSTLENCGVCKARGMSQCRSARKQLNDAQNKLVKSVDQDNPKGWAHR